MVKQPKNDQGHPSGPLAVLQPLYIDYRPYCATIELGAERPSSDELYGVENPIRDILTSLSDSGFEPKVTPQGYAIKLAMSGAGIDSGFDARAKRKLTDLVQPKFRARGNAVADVKRVQGHHRGTVVTMTVTEGRPRPYTLDQVQALPGVLRAGRDDQGNLMFSPRQPDEVRTVTATVAEALGLYCLPVTIQDPDPQLALLKEYDFNGEVTS